MKLIRGALRCGMGLAALGWAGEGLLEVPRLRRAFSKTQTESTPGESKIIEHFAVQHLAFPAIAATMALAPHRLKGPLSSRIVRAFAAALSVILVIPETRVSFGAGEEKGDLFRRYPFPIRGRALKKLELVHVGGREINMIQAQHLVLNHWLFTGLLIAITIDSRVLDWLQHPGPTRGMR